MTMLSRLWFGKKETLQLPSAEQLEEQKKKEIKKQLEEDLENRLRSLDRFPGSLSEYIALKREEGLDYSHILVPMSTGRVDKFVYDPANCSDCEPNWMEKERKLLITLTEDGCIGLIRYLSNWARSNSVISYGIPVKIKNNPPYR